MARINVYLPDELAREARAAGLNISRVTQQALSSTLQEDQTERWLDRLERQPPPEVTHDQVIEAIDWAHNELGGVAAG